MVRIAFSTQLQTNYLTCLFFFVHSIWCGKYGHQRRACPLLK